MKYSTCHATCLSCKQNYWAHPNTVNYLSGCVHSRLVAQYFLSGIKLFTGGLNLLERYPFPSWCLSQSSTLCLRLSSSDWRFKQNTLFYCLKTIPPGSTRYIWFIHIFSQSLHLKLYTLYTILISN